MRLLLLLFVLIAHAPIINAQLSYGVECATGFSYRRSLPIGMTSVDELLEIDQQERGNFGYLVGLRLLAGGDSKVNFSTGINYQRTSYRVRPLDIAVGDEQLVEVFEQRQQFDFHNIEVPFALHFYQDVAEQHRVYFKLGMAVLYHIGRNQTTSLFQEGTLREQNTTKINSGADLNTGLVMGLGYETKISQRLELFVEPVFRYYLRSHFDDDRFGRQPYLLGVSAGIKLSEN